MGLRLVAFLLASDCRSQGALMITRRLLQTLEIPVEFGWTLCAK
jgi:hypothetical protein